MNAGRLLGRIGRRIITSKDHLQIDLPRPAVQLEGDAYQETCGERQRALNLRPRVVEVPDPLDILARLYCLCGSLAALLGSWAGGVIVAIGIRGIAGAPSRGDAAADFGVFLIVHGAIAILVGWILALMLFGVGRSLARRERYWFCFLSACYFCLLVPMLWLGIPTVVLLTHPGVKASFAPSRKGWPLSVW